jgi:hypothetical protein
VPIAALLLFLAAPSNSPADPAVDWDRAALAPAIRDKVHLTVKEVPTFPHEDPKLINPGSWPPVTYVKGAPCFLKIETGRGDKLWNVSSLNQVKPGAYLSLFYESGPWGGRLSHSGPTYRWRGKRLFERYWTERSGGDYEIRGYMYYASGQLFRYSHRKTSYDPRKEPKGPFEVFEELFARDGALIGCSYAAGGGPAPISYAGYWLGSDVSYGQFLDRKAVAQAAAMK